MTSNVVSIHAPRYLGVPNATAQDPFSQVDWIFQQRLSRVPSRSGRDNYRYARTFYLKYLKETHGLSPYVLCVQWDSLAMVRFKAWLLAQEQANSLQFGGHTVVGIMSAVRQVMTEAQILGIAASGSIINAPMSAAYPVTDMHAPYTTEEMADILEAVKTDMQYTLAILRGYTKTGVGRDPQVRPKGLGINPRDYAKHGYGWNSEDNMRWYFENRMSCRAISRTDPDGPKHAPFLHAAGRYHGGYMPLYKRWGVTAQIDRDILWPLVIQLSYLTGLNPYSLMELKVDCLVEHPLTGTPALRYLKLRSKGEKELMLDLLNAKQPETPPEFDAAEMPLKREHSLLVQRTIDRILKLTQSVRALAPVELRNLLFIYESSGQNCHGEIQAAPAWKVNQWCREIGKRHNLRASSGKPLTFVLVRFRPTRLTEMAAVGKDFFEIQHVAGHKSVRQTLDYIEQRTLDTVAEREITKTLEQIWSNRQEFCETPPKESKSISVKVVPFKGLLSDCKNAFDPPPSVRLAVDYVQGQACTRFNMCLFCKNIVVMKEHLPVLALYRAQIRGAKSNTGVDLPHAVLYEKSLAILDQIFDPNTSEFGEEELDEAVAASELLDFVIDPLVYPGGDA
ncbi:hypothetical protein Q3O98_21110 [Ralstonia pseudosolanacearum]|uniref:hypothetical protein n=1 Tax=Ralstonia pseudosolanacearum TaxID=1310165 RepID=UPI0026774B6A|nr:hypothetical protein [Ralstonia pseudosolanacearum]MDO3623579.1 hypothetical protein [Ralstonia pseudosolanacearum]